MIRRIRVETLSVDSLDAAVGAAGEAGSKAAEASPPPAVSETEE